MITFVASNQSNYTLARQVQRVYGGARSLRADHSAASAAPRADVGAGAAGRREANRGVGRRPTCKSHRRVRRCAAGPQTVSALRTVVGAYPVAVIRAFEAVAALGRANDDVGQSLQYPLHVARSQVFHAEPLLERHDAHFPNGFRSGSRDSSCSSARRQIERSPRAFVIVLVRQLLPYGQHGGVER